MTDEPKNRLSNPKDNWDKLQVIAKSISLIFIPLLLALITFFLQSSLKQKEVKLRFVELAIRVLQENPEKSSKELREWAANIIEKDSDVKLGGAREILVNKSPLPKSWDEMGLTAPDKPINMQISNPDQIIISKDRCDLRCDNGVRSIVSGPYDYRIIKLNDLPKGSYAWTAAGDLKDKEDMIVEPTGWGPSNIEIQKNTEGKVFVVGYVNTQELSKKKVIFYPSRPQNNFPVDLVAIPLDLIGF